MENLIPVMNKLQNVLSAVGSEALLLPQIVVVGTQSSGKSSVLENLVGRSFLPRGVGIVTRRPLILQLVNVSTDDEEYGIFLHKKNTTFYNFDDIRREIESETRSKAGGNKGISEEPLSLKIFSNKVVNLTLIDLPGLTKVPVGDQPPDIENRIRKLLLKYVCNPNAIILTVITANTDMATSESLQMARDCDPEGLRTVAVVTKLDLMDSGTDAMDILSGNVIPVRLGIIGVVNRSQKDTLDNKPISEVIEDEADFLQKNYPAIAHRNGTAFLAKTLNRILVSHIRKCLPELKLRLAAVKSRTTAMLTLFGEDVMDNSKTLLQVITKFCSAYNAALDGTSRQIETTELCGGARICYVFLETFGKKLESIQPMMGLSKLDILTALKNASGTRPAFFVPEVCFEILVKKQISRLLEPSLRCVELIHEEMQQIIQQCGQEVQQEMLRFPKLFEKIVTIASEIIRRRVPETNNMVENLINLELAYINTMHPEFRKEADIVHELFRGENADNDLGAEKKASNLSINDKADKLQPATTPSGWFASFLPIHHGADKGSDVVSYGLIRTPGSCENFKDFKCPPDILAVQETAQTFSGRRFTERERRECKVIEKLINCYFGIVRRSIQDKVPKAIMYCLVNFVKENIQRELVEVLYKSNQDSDLLQEPEHIALRRDEHRALLGVLENAEVVLNEVREALV